jgi:hypothetical protein
LGKTRALRKPKNGDEQFAEGRGICWLLEEWVVDKLTWD